MEFNNVDSNNLEFNNAPVEIPEERTEEVVEPVKFVEEKTQEKKMKALVTCRVLFISALDKIYLITLILMFIILTYTNFRGDISSMSYGFWSRFGRELLIIIFMIIYYLFLNWFYRCAAKTMLCVTSNEVYKETYVPFKRTETSIPLNKITGVTTHNVFWIFRIIIIHQYGKLPMIFSTWNNQEFKDQLNELITTEKEKIENEYATRNIITKDKLKYLKYFIIAFVGIIVLIGIVRLFNYMFNEERKIVGTYSYKDDVIILNDDGSCNIDDVVSNTVTECSWEYDKENTVVQVEYSYSKYSYYWGASTYSSNLDLLYNSKDNTITYEKNIYTK